MVAVIAAVAEQHFFFPIHFDADLTFLALEILFWTNMYFVNFIDDFALFSLRLSSSFLSLCLQI